MQTANSSNEPMASRAPWVQALRFMLVMAILLGLFYPLITTWVGGMLFPDQAKGSLIHAEDGRVIGSRLVAQTFVGEQYFIGRPSSAGNDAGEVVGSNLAPDSLELRERASTDAAAVAAREGVSLDRVPLDLITASGSGIDPHISPAAADIQVARVAHARGIEEASVMALVDASLEHTGWLGSPVVNVLVLNARLDDRFPPPSTAME